MVRRLIAAGEFGGRSEEDEAGCKDRNTPKPAWERNNLA
jgi:hypothetical protein